jgi:hypothetical protein
MTTPTKRQLRRHIDELDIPGSEADDLQTITIRNVVVGSDWDGGDDDLEPGDVSLASVLRMEEQPDGTWTTERETFETPNDLANEADLS